MKKILVIIIALLAVVIGGVLFFFSNDTSNPYSDVAWGRFKGECSSTEVPTDDFGKDIPGCDLTVSEKEIPKFKEVKFPFTNIFDGDKSLPLMASCLIDIDNDGVDEVFMGGGVTQENKLFKYQNNVFTDISESVGLPKKEKGTTTFGAVSFDLNKDGLTDLLVAGDHGLFWYENTNNGFTAHNLNAKCNQQSTPATLTIGDYNHDGHADIFLATYIPLDKMEGQTIFNDKNYGSTSLLLKNNGDNSFTDVTKAAGLDYVHNTFQGIFVDMNNDTWLDLVVAYDTGEARTYKNNQDGTYTMVPNPITGKFAYPMGIALGDYNNDGLVDFFFSNTGTSVPDFMARGDLEKDQQYISEWILFRNDGDFKFINVAKETKVAGFEFSWGAIFQDFNLDGLQDLVVAENYVSFPPHLLFKLPCRFLLQRADGTFAAVEQQAGVINKYYGITPLTSDFNQDGYPDLIYTNLDGPVKAFINEGGTNHFIAVRFPETSEYVGTMVSIETASGKKATEYYVIGEGLGSDQTNVLTLGLGEETSIKTLRIAYPSGKVETIENPIIDKVHELLIVD